MCGTAWALAGCHDGLTGCALGVQCVLGLGLGGSMDAMLAGMLHDEPNAAVGALLVCMASH